MTKDDIATAVKHTVLEHFAIVNDDYIFERYLWDDLGADDLDYIELFMILEEKLDRSGLDCLDFESYRKLSVNDLVNHIDSILNPILESVN